MGGDEYVPHSVSSYLRLVGLFHRHMLVFKGSQDFVLLKQGIMPVPLEFRESVF